MGRPNRSPVKKIVAALTVVPPVVIPGVSRALVHSHAKTMGIRVITRTTADGVEVWRVG